MAKDPQEESSASKSKRLMGEEYISKVLSGAIGDDTDNGDPDEDFADADLDSDLFNDSWFDDDGDDGEINDDEITQMLDRTKERRAQLKTGDLDEITRDFEEFEDNLIATAGIGKTRHGSRRRITQGEARLSEEVKRKLGEANALYIAKDYGKAIDYLQELITEHPNVHQAWNTLGLIHDEMGNKDRSLQIRMVAAHMNQDDIALWKELGVKSIENGATQQAIYCFTKVLNVDPMDIDALWDRSFLYKQLGNMDEALDGFQQILDVVPYHFKVINEIAKIYRSKGQTSEAIRLYEEAIEHHIKVGEPSLATDEDDDFADELGYTEINMLSELYLMQNDYRRALETIKTGIRHVQNRQHETWWEDRPDDDEEYFEHGTDNEEEAERCEFPIELRVRMGVCRVYLGDVNIASRHFDYLLRYPATTYPDLHQDIAYAYMDKRHYDLALSVFQKIIDVSEEVEIDLLIRTADCYHEVGELETAAIFYINVLDEQPDNLDVMMSLASVYEEQGREEEALQLVEYVMKKNREARKQQKAKEQKSPEPEEKETPTKRVTRSAAKEKASLFDEATGAKISKTEQMKRRREERKSREKEKELETQAIFARLQELDDQLPPDIVGMDRNLMREYMRVAHELWKEFSETRAFFPKKVSRYTGFYALRTSKQQEKSSDNREAYHMAARLRKRVNRNVEMKDEDEDEDMDEEELRMQEEEEEEVRLTGGTHFRQIPFTKWLSVFIKYGLMLAQTRPADKAYDFLTRAAEANVFFRKPEFIAKLKMALLCCGLINRNYAIVLEAARWFERTYLFKDDVLRLFAAVLSGGYDDAGNFANQSVVKAHMRLMHMTDIIVKDETKSDDPDEPMEDAKSSEDTIGDDTINTDKAESEFLSQEYYILPDDIVRERVKELRRLNIELPDKVSTVLLNLVGSQMNIGRNQVASALFFLRAYAIKQDDPLNLLSLAIAMLQRAFNRKVDNRHNKVMQAMLFMQLYAKTRGDCQEVQYNIGRAFHLLGLTHLAIYHYERVLILPSTAKQAQGHVPCKTLDEVYDYNGESEEIDDDDDTDLRREAAYNLHLIYITSGAHNLAQILIAKYCCI